MKSVLRITLVILGVAVGAQAAAQEALVGEDHFTALYTQALRARAPELEIQISGPLELKIGPDGQEITAHLDNAYAVYRIAPDRLNEVINDFVLSTVESLNIGWAGVDVARIVPVIKDANFLNDMRQGSLGDRAAAAAHERYNDQLIILYAEDMQHSIRYLSNEDLDQLGVDRAGLREMAVENLGRLLPRMEARGRDGAYMLIADGTHEASLLLFDDIWTGEIWRTGSLPVTGELVIAVPARSMLLVTGSQDAAGLAMTREVADDVAANDPYAVTNQLFVYRDGRFQPFDD